MSHIPCSLCHIVMPQSLWGSCLQVMLPTDVFKWGMCCMNQLLHMLLGLGWEWLWQLRNVLPMSKKPFFASSMDILLVPGILHIIRGKSDCVNWLEEFDITILLYWYSRLESKVPVQRSAWWVPCSELPYFADLLKTEMISEALLVTMQVAFLVGMWKSSLSTALPVINVSQFTTGGDWDDGNSGCCREGGEGRGGRREKRKTDSKGVAFNRPSWARAREGAQLGKCARLAVCAQGGKERSDVPRMRTGSCSRLLPCLGSMPRGGRGLRLVCCLVWPLFTCLAEGFAPSSQRWVR